jgi:hypothetical protein
MQVGTAGVEPGAGLGGWFFATKQCSKLLFGVIAGKNFLHWKKHQSVAQTINPYVVPHAIAVAPGEQLEKILRGMDYE